MNWSLDRAGSSGLKLDGGNIAGLGEEPVEKEAQEVIGEAGVAEGAEFEDVVMIAVRREDLIKSMVVRV